MNKNDWYNTDSWYAPLQKDTPAAVEPIRKRGLKPWHIVGIIVLILAVLYAVYRFFAPMYYVGYDEEAGELPQEESETGGLEAEPAEKADQNG